jgi:hypothetical protein
MGLALSQRRIDGNRRLQSLLFIIFYPAYDLASCVSASGHQRRPWLSLSFSVSPITRFVC